MTIPWAAGDALGIAKRALAAGEGATGRRLLSRIAQRAIDAARHLACGGAETIDRLRERRYRRAVGPRHPIGNFLDELAQARRIRRVIERKLVGVREPQRDDAPETRHRGVLGELRVADLFHPQTVVVNRVVDAIWSGKH